MILDKIESLLAEVKEMKASNAEEIEALRLKYLSKKGEINAVMADFRNVPADQKKEVGMKINELKQTALERLNALRDAIETSEDGDQGLDLTRTAYLDKARNTPSADHRQERDHRHFLPYGICAC